MNCQVHKTVKISTKMWLKCTQLTQKYKKKKILCFASWSIRFGHVQKLCLYILHLYNIFLLEGDSVDPLDDLSTVKHCNHVTDQQHLNIFFFISTAVSFFFFFFPTIWPPLLVFIVECSHFQQWRFMYLRLFWHLYAVLPSLVLISVLGAVCLLHCNDFWIKLY